MNSVCRIQFLQEGGRTGSQGSFRLQFIGYLHCMRLILQPCNLLFIFDR